jgi:hypothetical protein
MMTSMTQDKYNLIDSVQTQLMGSVLGINSCIALSSVHQILCKFSWYSKSPKIDPKSTQTLSNTASVFVLLEVGQAKTGRFWFYLVPP